MVHEMVYVKIAVLAMIGIGMGASFSRLSVVPNLIIYLVCELIVSIAIAVIYFSMQSWSNPIGSYGIDSYVMMTIIAFESSAVPLGLSWFLGSIVGRYLSRRRDTDISRG